MAAVSLAFFLAAAAAPQLTVGEVDSRFHNVLFRQWPMLMTHDSATGYSKDGTCKPNTPINDWSVTQQGGGFLKQLECGARAFDIRPYVKKNGAVVMHHGKVIFETDIKVAVGEIKKWVESNKNEIVFIAVSHCDGEDDAAKKKCKLFDKNSPDGMIEGMGAKYLHCKDFVTMTVGNILAHGKQQNGGSLVYTWGNCVESNYDPSVECYGKGRRLDQGDIMVSHKAGDMAAAPQRELFFHHVKNGLNKVADAGKHAVDKAKNAGKHAVDKTRKATIHSNTCIGDTEDQQKYFDVFLKYLDHTTNKVTPPTNKMYMTQAHWQYSAKAIALGNTAFSCILNDEHLSKMNEKVAAEIRKGTYKNLFLLEVDNVCDHGPELAAALRSLAEKRLSTPQAKFDDSSLPMLAEPRTASFKAAAAFLLGGIGLVFAAVVAVRRGIPGCRSSAAAVYDRVPIICKE